MPRRSCLARHLFVGFTRRCHSFPASLSSFTQLNVEASQLFLARAQSQSSADEHAIKNGAHVPPVPVLARAITTTSTKTYLAPAVPAAAIVDAGIDSVMSASAGLDRVSSVVAAATPLVLPPPALLISSAVVADDCHSLDAEADAEVASMVDVSSARSGSVDSGLALVLSAPRFSPRRPEPEEMPPLQLDTQSHESRSVTSGSSDGASSAFTQRASLATHRASPPTLVQATAVDEFPAAARLRRDNIHSCPIKSKPPKAAANPKESVAARIFAPIAEGEKFPPAVAMMRSQSVCQRPSASPSPSCRRRLNFDAAAIRSDTPYKERLLLNAPLQEWLVAHLDGEGSSAAAAAAGRECMLSCITHSVFFSVCVSDPFPTADEKHALSKASGLSYDQVQAWFINNRGRSLEVRAEAHARRETCEGRPSAQLIKFSFLFFLYVQALKAKRDASLAAALHPAASADGALTPVSTAKKSKRVHTPQSVAGWVAAVEFRAPTPMGTAAATSVVFEAASSTRGGALVADGLNEKNGVIGGAEQAVDAAASDVASAGAFSTGKKSKAGVNNKRGKRSRV